jgi:hypothetical protein
MRSLAALALGAALCFTPVIAHADNIGGTHVKQVQEKKARHMKGAISSIDGETVVVSVTKKDGSKADRKCKTDSNTKITLDGKEAKLSDLKAGQEVAVTLGTEKGAAASEIEATSAAK